MDKKTFYVDIPDGVDGEWQGIDSFDSREEAVEFVRKHFGGDEHGCICLITTET